jgi:uncharacterized protein (TIGR02266 family)
MDGIEKRLFPRHPVLVEIEYVSDSPRLRARVVDLSEGGVFVDTLNPLEIGAPVRLSFRLADAPDARPIEGDGTVSWNQPMVGMGIRFTDLREEDRQRIRQYLRGMG